MNFWNVAAFFIIFCVSIADAATLPHPSLNDDRTFTVGPAQEIELLNVQWGKIKFVAFKRSLEGDPQAKEVFTARLNGIFNFSRELIQKLEKLFPNAKEILSSEELIIAVDDFGKSRKFLSAYHLPNYRRKGHHFVGLDNHDIAQQYWQYSLAHELTHVLAHKYNLPLWAEEMVALSIEFEMGGILPIQGVERFRNTISLPSLFSAKRPLINNDIYPMSFLMGRYLIQFGGWPLFQALVGVDPHPDCNPVNNDMEKMSCRLQKFVASTLHHQNFSEKLTPNGLVRFFATALVANYKAYSQFSIQGWQGFEQIKGTWPATATLEPGEFQVLDQNTNQLDRVNSNLEVYGLVKGVKKFQILSKKKINEFLDSLHHPNQIQILVINNTERSQLLFNP